MQRATGLEPVRMGRDPAHRMYGDRAAAHRIMAASSPVCPWQGELDLLFESDTPEIGGQSPDRRGRNAAGLSDRLGRVAGVKIALGHELKDWDGAPPAGQRSFANKTSRDTRRDTARERSGRPEHEWLASLAAGKEPVIGRTRRLDYQPGGIAVTNQIIEIDPIGFEQFVNQREHKEPVSPRSDPDPFVSDRRIAGAHRIYRDELCTATPQAR